MKTVLNGTNVEQRCISAANEQFVELAREIFELHANEPVGGPGLYEGCPAYFVLKEAGLPIDGVTDCLAYFLVPCKEVDQRPLDKRVNVEGKAAAFAELLDHMADSQNYDLKAGDVLTGRQALEVLSKLEESLRESSV